MSRPGQNETFGRRLRKGLGLERNIVVMLSSTLLLGMGTELWAKFVPVYLDLLGGGIWVIAVYGMLKDFLDAVYQYPGGWVADHLGRRRALVLFTLLGMIGYALYILSDDWFGVLVGTFFTMAWTSLALPAIFSIIGDNLPQARRAIGFGVQSILKRIPAVLAPLAGGWLIHRFGLSKGMKLGLGVSIMMALAAMFFVRYGYVEKEVRRPHKTKFMDVWREMDGRLKRLLLADCLVRWAEGIPAVFVVLYVMNKLHTGAFRFGSLTSIQMLTAIAVYIPIAKLADRMNRKPFVLLTFAFFALYPLALVNAQNFIWLAVAFAIAGLREIGEPARKALILDLAGEKIRGRTIGMYYLIRGLVVFPASLAGGWLWSLNYRLPFYTAFLAGLAGLFVYWKQPQETPV